MQTKANQTKWNDIYLLMKQSKYYLVRARPKQSLLNEIDKSRQISVTAEHLI